MAKRDLVLTACLLILMAQHAAGQGCPEAVGHWGYGEHEAAAWYGELALIPSGPKLLVVDFRLAAPDSIIGEVRLPGNTIGLEIEGDLAYAWIRRGPGLDEQLVAVDLSDPTDPVPLGKMDIAHQITDLAVQDSVAYVTSYQTGLVLVDISDPTRLRRLSTVLTGSRTVAVAARGDHAYVGTSGELIVLDVADPTSPSITARRSFQPVDPLLRLSETHLFVLTELALIVFDLSDPAQPARLGTSVTHPRPAGMRIVGTTVFLNGFGSGSPSGFFWMSVFDATDPLEMQRLGTYNSHDPFSLSAATDSTVLLSLGTLGTQLIDVTDPTAPQLAAELPPPAPPGEINDAAVDSDRQLAFLANTGNRFPSAWLRIIDVAGAGHFSEIARLGFDEPAYQVAISGDHVVLLCGRTGPPTMTIEVVDVSDPIQPAVDGSLQLSGPPSGELVVSGDLAFVTDSSLKIIDLADPTDPVLIGQAPAGPDFGDGLAVDGDRAYVTGTEVFCIHDVSDPTDPVDVSCTPVGGSGRGIAVRDGVSFVSVSLDSPQPAWTDELRLFDITDETAPAPLDSIRLWGSAGRINIDGDLLFVEVENRGLVVFDVSDPGTPIPAGLARVDAPAVGAGGRLYAPSGFQGLDVFDATSCHSPAPSADFVWSPSKPTLGEDVEFTDLSPGAPTSWSWDFGRGASSGDRNPTHSFNTGGRNTVALTVSNANGVSSIEFSVPVRSIADPPASSSIIPAAAHGDGKAGTRWRTDLALTSTSSEVTDNILYFMREGEDNTLSHGLRVSVPPGVTVLEDVVATVFGEDDAAGAIYVQTSRHWVSSRTYTLSEGGSFGQSIPPVHYNDTYDSPTLIQLTQNDGFRTNLGLVNRLGTPLTVGAQLYSSDHTVIAETAYDVEPFGYRQIDGFISELTAEPVEDGHVALFGGERGDFIAYASTIDNTTGDSVFMLPPAPTDEPLWIPAVAHVAGRNGTLWRTDLEVCADAALDAEYRLDLFESGSADPAPRSESFALDAGHCVRYADVVQSVFDTETTGSLRIVPESGQVLASSRTFTRRPDGGTYGQFIAAMPEWRMMTRGSYARLSPVSQYAEPSSGFRTNLGLLNTKESPALVVLEVHGADDLLLHEIEIKLGPFEHRQLNRFLDGIGAGDDLINASIVVRGRTWYSRYLVYASVVDNESGDSVFLVW